MYPNAPLHKNINVRSESGHNTFQAALLLPSLAPLVSCEPALLEGTSSGSPLSSNTLGSPASAPLNTHRGTERPLVFAIDAPTATLATFSPSRNKLAGVAACFQKTVRDSFISVGEKMGISIFRASTCNVEASSVCIWVC